MKNQKPLGAQISHALRARGVEVIFGIPGVHNVEMYRGIEQAGIRHVLARHEQGAGFMADGYARATGRPGVAYVITGPGLCNIMTPMGQAYSDSVPMLVMSSCLPDDGGGFAGGRLHEMKDQQAAAGCVCDWSHTALDADATFELIDRAFDEFSGQRARPKHIQVPIDLLGALADEPPEVPNRPALPLADNKHAAIVAGRLKSARRPLFVFGGGAKSSSHIARKLVARCDAAVFCTYAGKGIIASDYKLNFDAHLSRPATVKIIAAADLVLVIGSTLSEVDLWREDLGQTSATIAVNIDDIDLDFKEPGDIAVRGDAAAFLREVGKALGSHQHRSDWSAAAVPAAKTSFVASCDTERPGIVPVLSAMHEVLDQTTTIVSDMTQFAYVGKEVYDLNLPNRWHHPYGFGTLGYGLPAAIGAKIGLGKGQVVCIAGDYGFQYTVQELAVAVELELGLPIILWNNGKLQEIEDCMVRSQIAPNAVTALNPDFCALARAYGAQACRPGSLREFQTKLTRALQSDGPTLIELTPQMIL